MYEEIDNDGYYQDVDEARYEDACLYDEEDDDDRRYSNWGHRKPLPTRKSSAYVKAKNAKIGETITCANCGKKMIKKTYQQKFCCNRCKVKYHNRRFCNF